MKKGKKRNVKMRRRVLEQRLSIILISGVVVILTIVLCVASISRYKKLHNQEAQKLELEKEVQKEKERQEELDELEEHVGTDEYVEDAARENGLVYPGETIFEPE